MPRFPFVILFYLFAPCLLGVGIGLYLVQKIHWGWVILYGAGSITFGLAGFVWFWSAWWIPYLRFINHIKRFTTGKKTVLAKRQEKAYWLTPHQELLKLEHHFEEVIGFTIALSQHKFDTVLSEALQNSPFAPRLRAVSQKLQAKEQEAEKQSWTMRGLAEFSDILRNSAHLGIETLSNYFLSQLVKYMHAQQGVVYLLNEEDEQDKHLQLMAHYALAKTDFDNKRIELNEGLTGECFSKSKYFYIQDVHDDYSPIFSGLGTASPHAMLIFPIALHDKTIGVIEMASWQMYEDYQLDFLETICENFAVTAEGFFMQNQTQALLKKTEEVNAALLKQEKEREQKAKDLEEETNLLQYIRQAIDKTNATLEMDLNGNILKANAIFLEGMGYTAEEIVGKHEHVLLTDEDANAEVYHHVWEMLRNGNFIAGEYKRLTHDGKEVWLKATYNPISDTAGKLMRILMMAQFNQA